MWVLFLYEIEGSSSNRTKTLFMPFKTLNLGGINLLRRSNAPFRVSIWEYKLKPTAPLLTFIQNQPDLTVPFPHHQIGPNLTKLRSEMIILTNRKNPSDATKKKKKNVVSLRVPQTYLFAGTFP